MSEELQAGKRQAIFVRDVYLYSTHNFDGVISEAGRYFRVQKPSRLSRGELVILELTTDPASNDGGLDLWKVVTE